MTNATRRQPPRRYVVEVRSIALDWDGARGAIDRVRAVIDGSATPASVRLVRALTVPDDGSCLLVVEAPSRAAVQELARRADLEVRSLGETVRAAENDGRDPG